MIKLNKMKDIKRDGTTYLIYRKYQDEPIIAYYNNIVSSWTNSYVDPFDETEFVGWLPLYKKSECEIGEE